MPASAPNFRPFAVLVLAAAVLAACFVRSPASLPTLLGDTEPPIPDDLLPRERRLVEIFRDNAPSVVFITGSARVRTPVGFFRSRIETVPAGTGSGFMWDQKGHIVTNAHVIENASAIKVTLNDQSSYSAEVVGSYADKDIAVLRIDAPAEKLRPVKAGSSRELLEGMLAVAIGNPFGLDQTLTVGTVSALGREMRARNNRLITDVIQTDAAINPGNSGGPLLNSRGEVVGINTAILSPSGSNSGIGFAVPIDTARGVVRGIIEGKLRRAGLGVKIWPERNVNRFIARHFGVAGLLLAEVPESSAAEAAGLRPTVFYTNGDIDVGDLVVAIGDRRIGNLVDLQDALDQYDIGDEVEIHYIRDRGRQTAKVKLQPVEVRVRTGPR